MKPVGQILKELREGKKMSQREVSEQSGLTQSHICNIEIGTTEPTIPTMFKICRALEIDPSVLSNLMAHSFKYYLETTQNIEISKRRKLHLVS